MKFLVKSVLIVGLFFSGAVFAKESNSTLRALFDKWINTYASLKIDEQKELLALLKNYPLYPYAQAQFLESNLQRVPKQEIIDFVKNNKNFPVTANLARAYLAEQSSRKDWKAMSTFPYVNSTAVICQTKYAQFKQGQKKLPLGYIQKLWVSGKELPSECEPLLAEWEKAGKKTVNMFLLRIAIMIEQKNIKLAIYLAKQIPNKYKITKTNLLAMLDNPRKLSNFSENIPANAHTKKIVLAEFPFLARADASMAQKILPKIIKRQKLSLDETQSLKKMVANYYLNDTATTEQIKWRDNVISYSHDVELIEKRIRLAISRNDYDEVASWIKKLKPKDQSKDEWEYWKARALLYKDNENQNAKAILQSLAEKRGFYGMISAQALNQEYKVNNQSKTISELELEALRLKYDDLAVVKRITELRYFGQLSDSSREWRYYLGNLPKKDKENYIEFAQYANGRGWGDLSIQSTILGKLWDNWTERLPIMYKSLYNEALKGKNITLSYALAITRQESALDPTVQSPVGASGLMQLMPATAEFTAKNLAELTNYSKNQLFDPETNIQLGTHYLDYVYQNNSNNRILSSAAYNAGPHRVTSWLQKSNGQLDAVAFIESIPFNETRNYVKSVLVYDYIYQTKLNSDTIVFLNPNELNRKY